MCFGVTGVYAGIIIGVSSRLDKASGDTWATRALISVTEKLWTALGVWGDEPVEPVRSSRGDAGRSGARIVMSLWLNLKRARIG